MLANKKCFYKPDGGFYLWLNVGDGEKFSKLIWDRYAIKVMPGSYLATNNDGENPGQNFVRIALVDSLKDCNKAISKIVEVL